MRKSDNLPPHCAVVKKSESLNILDPSGPARPVMGELLPLVHFPFRYVTVQNIGFYPTLRVCIFRLFLAIIYEM